MSRETKPKRSNLYNALIPTIAILGALIIVAVFITWLTNSSQADVVASQTDQLDAKVMQQFQSDYDQRGVVVGSADAPITIREFADYQCPACKAFDPTATRIREDLVSGGKVRFIFFDFPLLQHKHAKQAAVAARCAGRQDDYWGYHKTLYSKQDKWAATDDPTAMFLDIAVENGLDAGKLKQCLTKDAPANAVQASREVGVKIGIRATPTVMVGSQVFTGGVSYDRIENMVKAQTGSDEE